MATRKTAAKAAKPAAAAAATTKPAEADGEQGASLLQTGTDHAGEVAERPQGAGETEAASSPAEAGAGAERDGAQAPVAGEVPTTGLSAVTHAGIEHIAMVAHEVNRAYCEAIGDLSQVPWDGAQDWQKRSAVAGVQFKLANPDATPEQQHNAWCSDKIKAGWACGAVKDAVARTHPCLVPYSALPLEQRVKDHLFVAVVRSLAGACRAPVGKAAGQA